MSASFKGTFGLNGRIFDHWADEKAFCDDFQQIAEIIASRSGLRIQVDHDRLKIAHEGWLSTVSAWLELLLPDGTKRLSHLKMCAILLERICELNCFSVTPADRKFEKPSVQDAGHSCDDLPNQLSQEDAKKLLDGGSHYLGWQVVYHICRHFEANRTDRVDPFVERVTEEFELDLVSALLSGRVSAQSIHLILKALFLRD